MSHEGPLGSSSGAILVTESPTTAVAVRATWAVSTRAVSAATRTADETGAVATSFVEAAALPAWVASGGVAGLAADGAFGCELALLEVLPPEAGLDGGG